jgi:hypothetical protein
MYELLNILESRNFTKDEHTEISKMILENIIYNPEIKGPLIQFVTLPGFYLHSVYNLDRTFMKPDYWISYIALNNRILKTKNPFDAAATDDTTFLNSQYKYNSILADKRSLLFNLYKTFPQVAFAYYIAMMSKGNWNNLQGIQSEAFILGNYIMNLTNENSSCQILFREFINTDIFNDVSNKTDIAVLFARFNSLVSLISKYQSEHKNQLTKWNDIEMDYFKNHIDEFILKTKGCDL